MVSVTHGSCCCCCQVTSVMSDSVRPHRQQPIRLPRPWDSPGRNTGVGCHLLLQCMKVKVKLFSCIRLLATPWTAAYQAPPSTGFSRQEYWSGVPLPSPLLTLCDLISQWFSFPLLLQIPQTGQNTLPVSSSRFPTSDHGARLS